MVNFLHESFSAAGEYYKNRCDPTEDGCIPCPNRIPSCKTLANGYHFINNLYDGLRYMVLCENNRTISYEVCNSGQGYCGETTSQIMEMSTVVTAEKRTTIMTEPLTTPAGATVISSPRQTPVTTHTLLLLPTTPQPGIMMSSYFYFVLPALRGMNKRRTIVDSWDNQMHHASLSSEM